jgi:hypothetical protein
MRERVNKPRAFLSHSSLDVEFIERIENDLRKCQIDSWRDRTEIRDGRRWQQVIFEEGIPTCDVIISYFTENSLASDMVAKEVDAAQLRQLQDNGIVFLPYVNKLEVRSKLRIDIQALHCRVWNEENYHEIFPSVVGEIWRSYMERNMAMVILQEKTRRLEAQLELERLQANLNDSAFSSQEEREFQHIYSKLQVLNEALCTVSVEREIEGKTQLIEVGKCKFKISFIEALMKHIDDGHSYFGHDFLDAIEREIKDSSLISLPIENGRLTGLHFEQDLKPTLTIFGLVKEVKPDTSLRTRHLFFSNYKFTEKMYRFISWLDYHGKFGKEPSFEFVEFIFDDSSSKEV